MRQRTTKQRMAMQRGLSLVEVLVALGIIAILLALLLPAISRSREAARRTQCQSQLRQIGLALSNYHDLHGGLPPGYSPGLTRGQEDTPDRWKSMYSSYAWSVHLLPFLDQSPLYDGLAINDQSLEELLDENPPDRVNLLSQPISLFRCPDDLAEETMETSPLWLSISRLNRGNKDGDRQQAPVYGGSSSYVANCGYYPENHPVSPQDGVTLNGVDAVSSKNNGLFFSGSHVRFADISDGLSQTIAIGERAWFQGSSNWVGTSNVRGTAPGGAGECLGRVYWRVNEIPDPPGFLITPENGERIGGNVTARSGFSSYHTGGAHMLFADGSVRFISEEIESRNPTPVNGVDVMTPVPDIELSGVWQRLGIRNDGLTVSDF